LIPKEHKADKRSTVEPLVLEQVDNEDKQLEEVLKQTLEEADQVEKIRQQRIIARREAKEAKQLAEVLAQSLVTKDTRPSWVKDERERMRLVKENKDERERLRLKSSPKKASKQSPLPFADVPTNVPVCGRQQPRSNNTDVAPKRASPKELTLDVILHNILSSPAKTHSELKEKCDQIKSLKLTKTQEQQYSKQEMIRIAVLMNTAYTNETK